MADLLFREIDPDELRASIVDEVVSAVRPIIEQLAKPPKRIANRAEMAEILGWSIAKLDRRTRDRAIPSMLDGDRRTYVIDDVIEAIKAGTPAADVKAAKRQAARQDAKRKRGGRRNEFGVGTNQDGGAE